MAKYSCFLTFIVTIIFLMPMSTVSVSGAPALQSSQVAVQITSLQYNAAQNEYITTFTVANVQRVQMLILTIEEEDSGTVIDEIPIDPGVRSTFTPNIDASGLKAEAKYLLIVRAVDLQGNYLPKVDRNGSSGDDPTRLAEKPFTHKPPQVGRAEFVIESVNVDYQRAYIDIMLNVPLTVDVDYYDGYIVDGSGARVADIKADLLSENGLVQVPIPLAMQRTGTTNEPEEYTLTINVTTEQDIVSRQTYVFKSVPPPPPGMITRISEVLTTNPWVLAGIFFIISAVIVYFLRKQKPTVADIPYRPVDRTSQLHIPTPPSLRPRGRPTRVRIRVIDSPNVPANTERIIEQFPYHLGRGDFLKDKQVSVNHVELSLQSGQLFITDYNSRNRTTVQDVPIALKEPVPLQGTTVVKLGLNTVIEIEPLS